MATSKILEKKITPRELALRDMRKAGLNTAVLTLRKTVIIEEIEEFISIDDGRILNGGRYVKRNIFIEETII